MHGKFESSLSDEDNYQNHEKLSSGAALLLGEGAGGLLASLFPGNIEMNLRSLLDNSSHCTYTYITLLSHFSPHFKS
jgi:hypothetical protein